MTVQQIMSELQSKGDEKIKKIFLNHGMKEPLFGVKIEHLKTIQKKVKKDYELAKEIFATGNADAMYLAALITDDEKMTKADLQRWVKQAISPMISEYTVAWVAAESRYGYELALEWIKAKEEHIAAAGWSTLSGLVALKADEELDIPALKTLLASIPKNIHTAQNRVRSTMNTFIIAAGSYVPALTEDAIAVAKKMGVVTIDKNGAVSKLSNAHEYINKIKAKGTIGKKKKTVKC